MLHTRELTRRDFGRHPQISIRMLRQLPSVDNTLWGRITAFVAPWRINGYPGRQRLLLSVIGYRVNYPALSRWGDVDRRIPAWGARAYAAHIEEQCLAGLALVAELREHAEALESVPHNLSAAGRMAKARAARRPGSAMGARARQLPKQHGAQNEDSAENGDEVADANDPAQFPQSSQSLFDF